MDRAADLDSARNFVIGRIAEQAKRSGEPLSDEQRLLLNFLPSAALASWDPEIPLLVPEKYQSRASLCARKGRIPT